MDMRRRLVDGLVTYLEGSPGLGTAAGLPVVSEYSMDARPDRPVVVVCAPGRERTHRRSDRVAWRVELLTQADEQESSATSKAQYDGWEAALDTALDSPYSTPGTQVTEITGLAVQFWRVENVDPEQDAETRARACTWSGVCRVTRPWADGTL